MPMLSRRQSVDNQPKSQSARSTPMAKRQSSAGTLSPSPGGKGAQHLERRRTESSMDNRSASAAGSPVAARSANAAVVVVAGIRPRLIRGATKPEGDLCSSPGGKGAQHLVRRRTESSLDYRSASAAGSPPGSARLADNASVVVVARIRPRLSREAKDPEGVEVLADGQTLLLTGPGRERKQFTLDQVFDSRQSDPQDSDSGEGRQGETSQANFFAGFGRGLVHHALSGYNVCVFAYGHTGSGKTYSMLGDAAGNSRGVSAGLLPRFLHELFAEQARLPRSGSWRCSCEYFEIYNEQIRDLLQPAQAQRALKVHCHPKHGARIEGLTMGVVTSAEEALALVSFGSQMRTVATTTMNQRSSRSHAFFTLKIEQLPPDSASNCTSSGDTNHCQSTVTFVDLAGREERERHTNQPGGTQFKEMCFINTSLFHLAHLITKISAGQIDQGSLSDFRNSKVTMMLSQALSGNSRTAVVATLSPVQSAFEDSLSTLNFASSAKKIQTKPVVNPRTSLSAVAELEAEVRKLQRALAETTTCKFEKEQELFAAQSWISQFRHSWKEAVARSEQQKLARQRSSARLGLCNSEPVSGSAASLSGVLRFDEAGVEDLGCDLPFLTKLCDDPALQGCCNYKLNRSTLRIGSGDGDCDIVLQGLGITRCMCCLEYGEDGAVLVKVLESDPGSGHVRALLNGQLLLAKDPPVTMNHGDSLMLGYSHAFRLVDPTPERVRRVGSADALTLARATLPKLDIASALEEAASASSKVFEEASQGFSGLPPFINYLSSHISHHIQSLVDEANLITEEVWGNTDLHFEVRALTDVVNCYDVPGVVVCGIEKPGPRTRFKQSVATVKHQLLGQSTAQAPGPHDTTCMLGYSKYPMTHALGLDKQMSIAGGGHLLSVWSLEEFLRRLTEIRDVYQDASDGGGSFEAIRQKLVACPFQNPWRQTTFADVKLLAESSASIKRNPILQWLLRCPATSPRKTKDVATAATAATAAAVAAVAVSVASSSAGRRGELLCQASKSPSSSRPVLRRRPFSLEFESSKSSSAASAATLDPECKQLARSPVPISGKEASSSTASAATLDPECKEPTRSPVTPSGDAASSSTSSAASSDLECKQLTSSPATVGGEAASSSTARSASSDPECIQLVSFVLRSPVNSTHPSPRVPSLSEYWSNVLRDSTTADVDLTVAEAGGSPNPSSSLPAHSLVLARLPFFRRLLEARSGGKTLQVPGVQSTSTLWQILIYTYSGCVEEATAGLSPNMLEELLPVALACGLQDLYQACAAKKAGNSASEIQSSSSPVQSQASSNTAQRSARLVVAEARVGSNAVSKGPEVIYLPLPPCTLAVALGPYDRGLMPSAVQAVPEPFDSDELSPCSHRSETGQLTNDPRHDVTPADDEERTAELLLESPAQQASEDDRMPSAAKELLLTHGEVLADSCTLVGQSSSSPSSAGPAVVSEQETFSSIAEGLALRIDSLTENVVQALRDEFRFERLRSYTGPVLPLLNVAGASAEAGCCAVNAPTPLNESRFMYKMHASTRSLSPGISSSSGPYRLRHLGEQGSMIRSRSMEPISSDSATASMLDAGTACRALSPSQAPAESHIRAGTFQQVRPGVTCVKGSLPRFSSPPLSRGCSYTASSRSLSPVRLTRDLQFSCHPGAHGACQKASATASTTATGARVVSEGSSLGERLSMLSPGPLQRAKLSTGAGTHSIVCQPGQAQPSEPVAGHKPTAAAKTSLSLSSLSGTSRSVSSLSGTAVYPRLLASSSVASLVTKSASKEVECQPTWRATPPRVQNASLTVRSNGIYNI